MKRRRYYPSITQQMKWMRQLHDDPQATDYWRDHVDAVLRSLRKLDGLRKVRGLEGLLADQSIGDELAEDAR